ncbi:MAG: Spore germination YpeB [Thermoanaerobacterales bacterium 50_218]|nr:MAG: Spore germination YpeB [Thermoanaerobacterales bacterium 50_218]
MKWSHQTIAIVALAVLWGITGVWGVSNMRARSQAEALLQNKYNRAFYETLQRTKNVEVLLSKALVSASPEQMDTIFSDLWYNANSAQENLNQVPVAHNIIARTSKFLTQVGDYSFTLAKNNKGQPLKEEDWETMEELYRKAKTLTKELARIEREAADGRFTWTEVKKGFIEQLSKGAVASADNSFRRIDTQLQELPVLVYDGPFSDHIEKIAPRGLTGEVITKDQAIEIARKFIDLRGSKIQEARIAGETRGKIPAYSVEFRIGEKPWEIISVDVSKKGGHVVYMINPRSVDTSKLTNDQILEKALSFLESRGLKDMVATYILKEENVATVSFVWKQDGVVIYPDLIKVQVALDNGQIVGFDALGYLTSHHKRSLPEPRVSWEQARAKLSPRVELLAERMAVVPTSGQREVLTYEFKTKLDDDTFLVYINALTGDEEHILKLLETPNGTLSL